MHAILVYVICMYKDHALKLWNTFAEEDKLNIPLQAK